MRIMRLPMAAVLLSVACATSDASRTESEVRGAISAYRAALNGGDSTSFFALLASDIEVLAPGAQPARGGAVREMFRPLFTQVKPELAPFSDEELLVSADLAIQRYTFRLTTTPRSGGQPSVETGSGLHIWKRMPDGRWQIVKDIWTNPPAPPGA